MKTGIFVLFTAISLASNIFHGICYRVNKYFEINESMRLKESKQFIYIARKWKAGFLP